MPCCEFSDRAQMSKTINAVRHFGLGGRKSLETAVNFNCKNLYSGDCGVMKIRKERMRTYKNLIFYN